MHKPKCSTFGIFYKRFQYFAIKLSYRSRIFALPLSPLCFIVAFSNCWPRDYTNTSVWCMVGHRSKCGLMAAVNHVGSSLFDLDMRTRMAVDLLLLGVFSFQSIFMWIVIANQGFWPTVFSLNNVWNHHCETFVIFMDHTVLWCGLLCLSLRSLQFQLCGEKRPGWMIRELSLYIIISSK